VDGTPNGLAYQGEAHFNTVGRSEQLTVTVDDLGNIGAPGRLTAQEEVRITVSPVNDAPFVANPIAENNPIPKTIVVNEDSPQILLELVPDVFDDPDIATNGQTLSLSVVNNSNPQLVLSTINGTILSLQLAADQSGDAEITVQASDGSETVQDMFTLRVLPVNDAPRTQADFFVVTGDTSSTVDVLANDNDIDGSLVPSSVAIVSAPNNADVSANADGTVTVTPARGFRGTTSFSYSVEDNDGAESLPTTVTIEVNDPPTVQDDAASTRQGEAVVIDVLANDFDSDGTVDPASVAVTRPPTNGTTSVDPQTGEVTYTPFSTFHGDNSFEYTVQDDDGGVSKPATVSITVTPVCYWHNPTEPLDVNADANISPIDALQLVNKLNADGAGPLPDPTPGNQPPPYFDVNCDGQITPVDALQVINYLNQGGGGEGEGVIVGSQADASQDWGHVTALVTPGYAEYAVPSQSPLVDELRQGRAGAQAVSDGHGPLGVAHFLADNVISAADNGQLSPAENSLEEALDDLVQGEDSNDADADAIDLFFAGLIE
jgi:hypothetical protein